ncbi:Spore germination protein [Acidisarcina polymorpha]|uniref:Spore germination protein n=1 Tax=Acidisarcina polymorpha TaxID=2211140 RepID=A0A2Z5FRZ5_9BACT|nr:GerMN domain-containing protein [Acidisarcina polymorpha]AXC09501.1 Spore germination protein [Acidisarcina polymorpha]
MIPRSLKILFWCLLAASVVMAVVLIRLREQAADRLTSHAFDANGNPASLPLTEPVPAATESITLLEANDLDGSLAPVTRSLALPQETGARARVLLRQLVSDYASPESQHPLVPGPGITAVFFMPDPNPQIDNQGDGANTTRSRQQTAVVDLTSAFAENHPSGIAVESLTLLSIIGTLHENFPAVDEVRFLVDGQSRETLAGHADLTRTYLAAPAETRP